MTCVPGGIQYDLLSHDPAPLEPALSSKKEILTRTKNAGSAAPVPGHDEILNLF
jgi:hypothetical protein